jgi:hypothetical protein
MADYYSILAQAVGVLDPNTADTRGQLYNRARSAMISKLEDAMPPFSGADIAAAKIAFESAVAKVEAEAVLRYIAASSVREAPASNSDSEGGRAERSPATSSPPARETWLTDVLERTSDGVDDGHSHAPKRARGGDA